MFQIYLFWAAKSLTFWVGFFIAFLLGLYFFQIFDGSTFSFYRLGVGLVYSTLLGIISGCLFKSLKEKLAQLLEERKLKNPLKGFIENLRSGRRKEAFLTLFREGFKFLVLFGAILGIGAAQFCVFGSPVCTFSVGAAIVTAIFPQFMVYWLYEYANQIVIGAIIFQLIGLFFMGCFKRVPA
ncbi:MAG: hypothetical protein GXN97_06870 [Aquificae bacterium]|nr:hypothetical protein [Aquificota bacterium]